MKCATGQRRHNGRSGRRGSDRRRSNHGIARCNLWRRRCLLWSNKIRLRRGGANCGGRSGHARRSRTWKGIDMERSGCCRCPELLHDRRWRRRRRRRRRSRLSGAAFVLRLVSGLRLRWRRDERHGAPSSHDAKKQHAMLHDVPQPIDGFLPCSHYPPHSLDRAIGPHLRHELPGCQVEQTCGIAILRIDAG